MKSLNDILQEGLLTAHDPHIPEVPDKYSRIPLNLLRLFNTDDIIEFKKLTHLVKDEVIRLSPRELRSNSILRGKDNVFIGWFSNNIGTHNHGLVQDVYLLTIYYSGVLYRIGWETGWEGTGSGWSETYGPKFARLHKNVREWMLMPCHRLSPEVSAEIIQALGQIEFEDVN